MAERLHNKPNMIEFRKELRNNSTEAEIFLWNLLKQNQLEGRKFRRQHSIDNYIVDFYCPQERLAIELDGDGHYTEKGMNYDKERTAYLESIDITVVRFENYMVLQETEAVLERIKSCFK